MRSEARLLILSILTASLAGNGNVRNPGGERIPFVKLRSEVWDVVIRKTASDRARIERVNAQCQGIWVNACAPGVDPELRKIALERVFQDGVTLSGDFTYCSTAVVRELPEDLGRKLIRPGTGEFCEVFLDPSSVAGLRSGDATSGENDLVGRLMGGQNTTSGRIMIKAPPTVSGTQSGDAFEATGEKRQPGMRPAPQPTMPSATEAASQAPPPPEPSAPEPSAPAPASSAPAEAPPPPEPAIPEHQAKGDFEDFVMPEPAMGGGAARDLLSGEPDPEPPVFAPEPEPVAEPVDPELAALLAPVPEIDSQGALRKADVPSPAPAPAPEPAPAAPARDLAPPPPEPKGDLTGPTGKMNAAAVSVPAPKPEPVRPPPEPTPPPPPPKPKGPSEFELEAREMDSMEPLSAAGEDEDDKKKKKKGKNKDEPAEASSVGGDDQFEDYIIIDIEGLPEE